MAEVIFNFKGVETTIQCNINDKMKEIKNKFITKTQNKENKIYFLYNGDKINEELSFSQLANELDNQTKKMKILVYEKVENKENKKEIKSKEIICPDCGENILIKFLDNKINLYECKNGHYKNNILYEEYENTQKIELSKIICDQCKNKSRDNTYNNEFYICNSCNLKLCPLCKSIHNNNHNIINYNDKNYICKKHNDNYIKYCKECKENMCILCENEHNNHDIIYLGNMIINKDDLIKENEELKNIIDKLRENIEEIKNMLNKILNNVEIYYKINKEMIDNYDNKKRNYYILKNINELKDKNKNIMKDINEIIKENDINKKFNYLMYIYDNNNYVNKSEIYENGDRYIGEFKNKKRNGKGIMYYSKNNENNREKYEGEWKDGKMEGKGKMYWNYGDIYEGDFKNDKKEGKGIYYLNDGGGYEGDFKNNKKEGKGIMYWNSGDRYEGDFKNDKRGGKGIFYYKNQDREMGDYLNDKKIGIHVKLTSNGKVNKNKY